jgi:hypothetical protein
MEKFCGIPNLLSKVGGGSGGNSDSSKGMKCGDKFSAVQGDTEVEIKRFSWLLSLLLLIPSVSGCDFMLRTHLE